MPMVSEIIKSVFGTTDTKLKLIPKDRIVKFMYKLLYESEELRQVKMRLLIELYAMNPLHEFFTNLTDEEKKFFDDAKAHRAKALLSK